jgi:hypothetical protein
MRNVESAAWVTVRQFVEPDRVSIRGKTMSNDAWIRRVSLRVNGCAARHLREDVALRDNSTLI